MEVDGSGGFLELTQRSIEFGCTDLVHALKKDVVRPFCRNVRQSAPKAGKYFPTATPVGRSTGNVVTFQADNVFTALLSEGGKCRTGIPYCCFLSYDLFLGLGQ